MAKATQKDFLITVATEMNKVMQYGGKEGETDYDPSELIDTTMVAGAIKQEIIERAKADLRLTDQASFSPEVWQWFVDENLVRYEATLENPNTDPVQLTEDTIKDTDLETQPETAINNLISEAMEINEIKEFVVDIDNSDENNYPTEEPEIEEVKVVEPEQQDSPKEEELPPPSPEEIERSKRRSTGKVRASNPRAGMRIRGENREQLAERMIRDGKSFAEIYEVLAEQYHAQGETNEVFIEKRVKIYYNIGCKRAKLPEAPKPQKYPRFGEIEANEGEVQQNSTADTPITPTTEPVPTPEIQTPSTSEDKPSESTDVSVTNTTVQ